MIKRQWTGTCSLTKSACRGTRTGFRSAANSFNGDIGLTTEKSENHGLSVFVRDGEDIFRTYFTTARGLEAPGTVWTLLDMTAFGRQETWESSPEGRPQSAPFQWWRRHDQYDDNHNP
jgi:predicted dithiol-disulfide oxidoreductase (DUF899 family)